MSMEERDYRLRVYEATKPAPYQPYYVPQPYVMQPPRSTSTNCMNFGGVVHCDTY